MMKRRSLFLSLALFAFASSSSFAEEWPQRTVRIIVPTAPGGSIDTTARVVASFLQEKWGKPVVIENRAGAGMRIGADAVAKSAPDGYTILVAHDGTMAMNAVVYKSLPYNPVRDFEPLALIASIPEVLVVNKKVPVTTVQDFIALAKKKPGELNHASGGTATLLALELFKSMAGVDITSVPFVGGAPAVTAVISGAVDVLFADAGTAAPALQSPNITLLATTTLKRPKAFPNTPTIDEAGVRGFDVPTWIGAFAPAGTPKDIVRKFEADIALAMQSPTVRSRLEAISMEMGKGSAQELRETLAADIAKWGRLVTERNIQIEQN